ncbi:DJ-1/PfpI family protein [Pantoea sp. 1.19]|uniref:DJ-1/PfpI family protein n=1 Tax=Pantoea sp. 1.19 TaxID=1925589 RepID=UPI0009490DA6|nr:DJ-1/PfpI family protein [Pantoea sp. 1.19]
MDRRDFLKLSAASYFLSQLQPALATPRTAIPGASTKRITFVLFENMTPLDLIGPMTLLQFSGYELEYVWHRTGTVKTEIEAVNLIANKRFDDITDTSVLCIPGTGNPYRTIEDRQLLAFLHRVGQRAEYVTSICTGAIILAAAGLMHGYRATTHWSMLDDLSRFGAIPLQQRVVTDRNRITGGGVTAGIDFGLQLLAVLTSQHNAELAQLITQYDPHPPFNAGSPQSASPAVVEAAKQRIFANVAQATPNYQQILTRAANDAQG